jgi:anti-sigma factor RsiW
MSSHIQFATLADFIENRLGAADNADVREHLAACAACAGQAARLREVTGLMRADQMEDPPQAAVARAINLFHSRPKPIEKESPVRRVLAALQFDSLQMAPAFGLRSGATTERQLLFSAGENELQLQIASAGEAWQVTGQVLGPCQGGEAELRGATKTVRAPLNDLCEFVLAPMAEGDYSLMLRLDQFELEIPELKLGESRA